MREKKINHLIIVVTILLVVSMGCSGSDEKKSVGIPVITVDALKARQESGDNVHLLDVRTIAEYDGELGHLEGGMLIPHDEVGNRLEELEDWKGDEIIVYCRSGRRSALATKVLLDNGFNAVNLKGGIKAWRQLSAK